MHFEVFWGSGVVMEGSVPDMLWNLVGRLLSPVKLRGSQLRQNPSQLHTGNPKNDRASSNLTWRLKITHFSYVRWFSHIFPFPCFSLFKGIVSSYIGRICFCRGFPGKSLGDNSMAVAATAGCSGPDAFCHYVRTPGREPIKLGGYPPVIKHGLLENPSLVGFPINTSIYRGFPLAIWRFHQGKEGGSMREPRIL